MPCAALAHISKLYHTFPDSLMPVTDITPSDRFLKSATGEKEFKYVSQLDTSEVLGKAV